MRAWAGAAVVFFLFAAPASAQKEDVTEHVSVAIDGGFLTDYDDTQMWDHGYDVGITGLWALSASTSLCARFGLSHWAYTAASVVDDLVPDSAQLTAERSTGQIEVMVLTPMIRYQREAVIGRLGAFVEGGAGLAYTKTFALTEVIYEAGAAGTQVKRFEVDESDVGANVRLGAGLSHAISSSSWIDVVPTYRVILGEETSGVAAISVGFRVRV